MSIVCLYFPVCGQLSILPNPSNLAPGSPVRLNIRLDWVSLWCSPHTAALTFSWGVSHSDSTFPLRTSHPVVFQCALTTSLSLMFDWQEEGQRAVDRTNQTGLGLKFPSTVQGPGAALALLCSQMGDFGCLGCSAHLAPAAGWEQSKTVMLTHFKPIIVKDDRHQLRCLPLVLPTLPFRLYLLPWAMASLPTSPSTAGLALHFNRVTGAIRRESATTTSVHLPYPPSSCCCAVVFVQPQPLVRLVDLCLLRI